MLRSHFPFLIYARDEVSTTCVSRWIQNSTHAFRCSTHPLMRVVLTSYSHWRSTRGRASLPAAKTVCYAGLKKERKTIR